MTIEEATANLVDAMQRTSSGELLRLSMLLLEASDSATERRGEEELVFRAMGPLIGAVLYARHKNEIPKGG